MSYVFCPAPGCSCSASGHPVQLHSSGAQPQACGWPADPGSGVQAISCLAEKLNVGGVVAITAGNKPTTVAVNGDTTVLTYDVDPVPEGMIGDSDGCGDAFVGGFLAGVVTGQGLDDCVSQGHRTAAAILRSHGVPEDLSMIIDSRQT